MSPCCTARSKPPDVITHMSFVFMMVRPRLVEIASLTI